MKRSSLWFVLGAWAALFLTLGGWALASPVGSSPDDDFHLASIWCGQGERDGLCELGSEDNTRFVPSKALDAPCYAYNEFLTASCQGAGFQDEGLTLVETDRVNSGTQYPSGFYYVMSFFASDNIAVSVIMIRLVNAALFATLIVGTAALLPRDLRFTLLGSVALTFVPLGLYTIASVNPSSWSLLSNAVLFPALLGFFATTGKNRWAFGAVSSLALIMSISSRGDSAAFSIIAVLAAGALAFRSTRKFWIAAILPVCMICISAFAFLSAGQTSLAVNGEMGGVADQNPTSPAALAFLNVLALPSLWRGIFGDGWGLGWLDTPIPSFASTALLFVAFGVLFAALRCIDWRKALALTGVGSAAIVFPVFILVQSGSLVGANVQPRYLLPLLTLFLAVALAPSARSARPLSAELTAPLLTRTQLVIVACALATGHAISLYFTLKRNVTTGAFNLDAAIQWWWNAGPSPLTVLTISVFASVAALIMLTEVTRRDAIAQPARHQHATVQQ